MSSDFSIGADASDNMTFIGLVLGYKTDVARLHNGVCKECKLPRIHMRRIISKRKVVEAMRRFCTDSVHMYCFTVNRQEHARTLDSAAKTRYLSGTQKNQNIDYCIVMEIKAAVRSSLEYFYLGWSDIVVEVDQDTKKMFKTTGIPVTAPDNAHELADAVAWVNHAKSRMDRVKNIDITADIERRLRRKLRL